MAVLLWVSACGDSSVSFGPDVGDDDDDVGGSSSIAGTGNGASGSSSIAGTGATAGTDSDEGGAGTGSGGSEAGGSESGGTNSAGTEAGGSAAGSGGGNASGSGGTGGSAGSGNESGSGGTGGAGGTTAGTGGSDAGGSGGSGPVTCDTNNFFQGHSYAFCGQVDSVTAGYEKCQSLGMSMVTIESKQENDYVLGKQKSSTWLGGTDEGHEKDWIWATGVYFTKNDKPVQFVYSNWLQGQPNNDNKDGLNENCLVLTGTDGKWNDVACTLGDFKVTCESTGPGIPTP